MGFSFSITSNCKSAAQIAIWREESTLKALNALNEQRPCQTHKGVPAAGDRVELGGRVGFSLVLRAIDALRERSCEDHIVRHHGNASSTMLSLAGRYFVAASCARLGVGRAPSRNTEPMAVRHWRDALPGLVGQRCEGIVSQASGHERLRCRPERKSGTTRP